MGEINIVNVRWWDGYLETFEATEVRAGGFRLWMRLTTGTERQIPLLGVRWWSQSIESHGTDPARDECTFVCQAKRVHAAGGHMPPREDGTCAWCGEPTGQPAHDGAGE